MHESDCSTIDVVNATAVTISSELSFKWKIYSVFNHLRNAAMAEYQIWLHRPPPPFSF